MSVTDLDRLKADPYAFYAKQVLRLLPLDPVDADPSAAWRGTAVHAIMEQWWVEDDCAPDKLMARATALLASEETHPLMRALWQPRLLEAVQFIADRMAAQAGEGRVVVSAEGKGEIALHGRHLVGPL